MAIEWDNVRLERSVAEKLVDVRIHLIRSHELGFRTLEMDNRDRVSFSQVVEILCDEFMNHVQRGRKKKAKSTN